MAEPDRIAVEIAHAGPERQRLQRLVLPAGATIADALAAAGLAGEASRPGVAVGIWSKPMPAESRLQDGDRVELYRPLKVDPKEARRRRAARRNQP